MMKKMTLLLVGIFALFSTMLSPIFATTPSTTAMPAIIPPAPNIKSKGFVVMDAATGKILASKNMNRRLQPASLTKLMTLYITFQALAQGQIKLTDKVRVSKEAWSTGGSRMFLKLGSHVPVKDLIRGIITASGNDACVALSQFIAGSQHSFAQLMNLTAKRLGMTDSHFVDPTGLPKPQHYSTPYNLALLTRAIITNFPQYYPFFKEKWITWNHIKQPNRNRLLWRDPYVDGLKTGHTKEAGYCLITSAKRNDMRLITVVMGTPTDSARANDSQALLNWGFRFYKSFTLYKAGSPLTSPRVWLAETKTVPLGLAQNLVITIPAGEYKNLKAHMVLTPKLKAPITKGTTYGEITVTLNGKLIAKAPLIALKNNSRGGFWSRMVDHVSMML